MKVWMRIKRLKVPQKIILYFSAGLLIFYICTVLILEGRMRKNMMREKIADAKNLSQFISSFVSASMILGEIISIKSDIQPFKSKGDLSAVVITDKNGDILVTEVTNPGCISCHGEEKPGEFVRNKTGVHIIKRHKMEKVVMVDSDVISETEEGAIGKVYVFLSTKRSQEEILSLFRNTALIILIPLFLILAGGHVLVRFSIAIPLRKVTKILEESVKNAAGIAAEVQTGTSEQAASVTELAGSSEEIAASAIQVAEMVKNSESLSREGAVSAEESERAVDGMVNEILSVKEKINELARKIVSLSELSQRIGWINSLIEDISDQTRLLAVNASIEATGAGEAGKRFGVVASEIRNLSMRTREATDDVKKIVEEILSSITKTVMTTEEGVKSFEYLSRKAEGMKEIFRLLKEKSREIYKISMDVREAISQQVNSSAQMAKALDEIKEVANGIAESGARVSEMISNLEKIMKEMEMLV